MNDSAGNWHAARDQVVRRAGQIARVIREDGTRGLAGRALRAASRRLDDPSSTLPVRAREVLRAGPLTPMPSRAEHSASSRPSGAAEPTLTEPTLTEPTLAGGSAPEPSASGPSAAVTAETGRPVARAAAREDVPLVVNWVMTPPPPGSGGHTTLLRLVEHLERSGHTCRLYFYDRYAGDIRTHTDVFRGYWPQIRAEVADATGPMQPCDAVFATSWQSAYVVADPRTPGRRFYCVQDFEPLFYPAGSESLLAENTFRFGFHGVTAGRWLAEKLTAEYGMPCDYFEFGADTDVYRVDADAERPVRDGVVFYAKPSTPRRAYSLGLLALEEFHRRHPDVPIHLFGENVGALPFPAQRHGVITPSELNALYNRCLAGLCLSVTNISLIPFELLAAGCIPVVNDARHNRLVLDNPHVRYVQPTPGELAAALSDVVSATPPGQREERARAAAASMADLPWDAAGAAVERVLLRELRGVPAQQEAAGPALVGVPGGASREDFRSVPVEARVE